MAGQALKTVANSDMIKNLILEKQMSRLTYCFKNEEMAVDARVQIGQAFLIVAKDRNFRKLFFQRELLNLLFSFALKIITESKK